MAHQMAPSVNCSLDEIDLNALKVLIKIDNIYTHTYNLIVFFCFVVLDNFNSEFSVLNGNNGWRGNKCRQIIAFYPYTVVQ